MSEPRFKAHSAGIICMRNRGNRRIKCAALTSMREDRSQAASRTEFDPESGLWIHYQRVSVSTQGCLWEY